MDGSGSSIVISSGYIDSYTYDLAFTLDRSQQALYWINGTRYNHCYLQRSNTDGSNRSIAFNATGYYGGCLYYYYRNYYSNPPDIDFFDRAVYTSSGFYNQLRITNTDERSYAATFSYRSYICSRNSFHGIKVISREQQLQSMCIYAIYIRPLIPCHALLL